MNQKKFNEIISHFGSDPKKAKRCLSDKRLSQLEKLIIECYLLLRDKKNKLVYENLVKFSNDAPPFVLAHKKLLLGLVCNNLGKTDEAEHYLLTALSYFSTNGFEYFELVARINLFILYDNCKKIDQMEQVMRDLSRMPRSNPDHLIKIVLCEFFYQVNSGLYVEAEKTVKEILRLKAYMRESEFPVFLSSLFDLHIRNSAFDKAESVLEEMKLYRKYNLKEDLVYWRLLFDHLVHDRPIYFYDKSFQHHPWLFYELKVIQHLEEKSLEAAQRHWQELEKGYPHLYGKDFSYLGEQSLFSLCLKKQLEKLEALITQDVKVKSDKEIASAQKVLEKLFSKAEVSVAKEALYEMIWGEPPQKKEDLNKLINCIARFRRSTGLSLRYKKGCYYIENLSSKKAG